VFVLLLVFIMFVLCRYIIVTITRLCSGLVFLNMYKNHIRINPLSVKLTTKP